MAKFEDEEVGAQFPEFLRDPFGVVRRRWLWMLAALVVGGLGTGAFVTSIQPRYRAETTVLITSQQIREDIVRPTLREDSLQRINALVGEILSRETLSELVQKHGLYEELWDELALTDIAAIVREDVSIEAEQGLQSHGTQAARLYKISFRADESELAAAMANDLASHFTSESIRSRSQQSRLTTEFLARELQDAEVELRTHNKLITEFKQRYRGELPGELESNLRKLERLGQSRQSLALQIAEAETRLALLTSGEAAPNTPEARLSELRSRLAEQRAYHTEEHPNVSSLVRQIEALEREIEKAGAGASQTPTRVTLVAAAQRKLGELRTQLDLADQQIGDLDARVAVTPARQEELDALEEKGGVLREKYLEFLRKVQESELAQNLESAQQGARVSVLDRAEPPARPERTRLKYLLAGSLGTFLLAIGVGILLEFLDPVLLSSAQIESVTGFRVLGSVPRIH